MLVRVVIAAVGIGAGLVVGGPAGTVIAVICLVVAAWPKRRAPIAVDDDE